MAYDDAKYGVIERKWFGLTKKHGGDAASGFTFGTTDATSITHVTRFYPKGPIQIVKAGIYRLATFTQASSDLVPVRFYTRGGSASLACTVNAKATSTAVAPFTIASNITPTYPKIKAAEYLVIKSGTPKTDKGTAANTATLAGSCAFFIDYKRLYDTGGAWD
jgi:hypothetical protein